MIRIHHLIPKRELFNWLEKPEISKILLYRKRNKLKNINLCDIYAFYHTEFTEITVILGACKVIINKDGLDGFLDGKDHSFLNGLQSQKQHSFLSKSMVIKLISIEEKYEVNLSISKKIREIIYKTKL